MSALDYYLQDRGRRREGKKEERERERAEGWGRLTLYTHK
jgi:hypothetical protein